MAQSLISLVGSLLVAFLAVGCQHSARVHSSESPLTNKIWDVKKQTTLSQDVLLEQLRAHSYVLLGEVHDNPAHHAHQAEIVSALRTRPVVMEHLTAIQAQALNARIQGKSTERLQNVLEWEKSGWPDFELFSLLFKTLLQNKSKIIDGGLSRTDLKNIRSGSSGPLPRSTAKRLGGEAAHAEWDAKLRDILRDSHCGQMPEKLLPQMIRLQKYKDMFMAWQLSKASNGILLAGLGHTRNDWGVPYYLTRAKPGASIATVAFVEVEAQKDDPKQYQEIPADYLWFTTPQERPDPCAAFKRTKHIVLDAGHSPESPGTISTTDKHEVFYNDQFVGDLTDALNELHVGRVLLSRKPSETLSLRDRVDKIKALVPDVVLSIHHDSMHERYLEKRATGGWVTREPTSGFSLFVGTIGEFVKESRSLAELIGDNLLRIERQPTLHHAEDIPGENRALLDSERGIYEFNELALMKHTAAPTVLVELGLIVDEDDERYVADAANRKKMAHALATAVAKFLRSQNQ